jgi:prepilin-type N-terminal cleavage/methylation domain-containing protein
MRDHIGNELERQRRTCGCHAHACVSVLLRGSPAHASVGGAPISKPRRRGMTLIEMTVALVILGVAMVALLQLVAASARQRRTAEQRRIALQEVANQAERLALASWDEIAPGELTTWQPSAELTAVTPQALCRAEVSEDEGPPPARRIRLEVTWQNSAGLEVEPVELTIWKFRPEAQP